MTPLIALVVLLAPDVWMLPGWLGPERMPAGNTVIFRGADGLVVMDTGRGNEHTTALLAELEALGGDVEAIVNSHWHLDHLGGNLRLVGAYPDAVVHAGPGLDHARAGFMSRYSAQIGEMLEGGELSDERETQLRKELALVGAAERLAPDVVVEDSGPRSLAGRPLEVYLETRAVSEGDLWVYDPGTKLLAAGDLVVLPAPLFDTACPRYWQAALERIAATGFERLVPGHGKVMSRAEFERWREAFDGLLECAGSEGEAAACADGWYEAVGPLGEYHDASYARQLVEYYVTRHLRASPEDAERLCGK